MSLKAFEDNIFTSFPHNFILGLRYFFEMYINGQKCVRKTLTQTLTLTLQLTLKAILFHNSIHALSIQAIVG
jgi:hypothetical protein